MSNVEADDNDMDGDLIFISEEHIDLEESNQIKHDQEELESAGEKANMEVEQDTGDASNAVDGSELEQQTEKVEEQEEEQEVEQEAEEQELEDHEDKLEDKVVGKEGLLVVDEWDDDEMESDPDDEVKEKDENALNPEDIERSLLNMPQLKIVLDEMSHLKQNRRLAVHPLDLNELEHPKLKEVIESDACEEVKVQFVRSKSNDKVWTGIVVLNFTTTGSATQAMEKLKQIKENITVKPETNANFAVEHFIKESKIEKRWTDNVLIVRNLIDDVKLESLKELFPDAEEVVIHKEVSKRRESTIARGYAYLLYRTDELASNAAKEYKSKKLMLDGHRLYVLPYRLPLDNAPRGLLRLRERRLVLKHMDKLMKIIEKGKTDSTVKVPENAKQRFDKCKTVIERDNKARKDANLVAPSWEEMRHMVGLPILTAVDCQRFLVRLGIMEEKKQAEDNRSSQKQDRAKSPVRRNNKNPQRLRRKAPSPKNMRRSPRKRNWSQVGGRNQRPSGLRLDRNSAAIGGGMINPLALMMQQGMMGPGSMINPGMMMQQNMGASLLGASGLMGNVQQANLPSYLGGLGTQISGRGIEEPTAKILRLDESGNYRSTEDRRFHERESHRRNEGHQRVRDREERPLMRGGDIRLDRHRSRSPDHGRTGQHSDLRGYGESSSGMARHAASARSGDDSEISNPVNLLLNLSQMLSQKMEQKRQQVERERRSYDRGGDYGHGMQR